MANQTNLIVRGGADFSGLKKEMSKMQNSLKSFQTQSNVIASSLRKIGTIAAAAFGIRALVNFSKESIGASTELSNALIGLQSIVEGQGRSFQKAKEFINSYVQDGLIPATQAITAYKNLALRGYDDSQIQQVLIALKDSAAFGRQASLSMGQAVQSATEGLKNENSILVDNAGVTKNVAKMWDEYAKSIGTTANNLTKQQKIQAEVLGIMEETKYQIGDAAKVSDTYSGQLLRLQFAFNSLKVAVGNALIPIAQVVMPSINAMIAGLTRLANLAAQVTTALFGKQAAHQKAVASSGTAAAGAQKELAEATEAAGKAAMKSLARFDELNVLQKASGAEGASDGTQQAALLGLPDSMDVPGEVTLSPAVQAVVDKIKSLLEPLQKINFDSLNQAFDRLKEAIAPITASLFDGLKWAYDNIFVPFSLWAIQDAAPVFLDMLAAGANVLSAAIDALKPLGMWLWETFLQPLASWTGGAIVSILESIATALSGIADWINNHGEMIRGWIVGVATAFGLWKLIEFANYVQYIGALSQTKGLEALAATVQHLASVGFEGLKKSILGAWGEMKNIMAVSVEMIKNAALLAVEIGKQTVALVTNAAQWVWLKVQMIAATAAETARNTITAAGTAITVVATAATTAFGAAIAFLTSPIGLVILAIAAIIAIVVLLVKNWDWVKETAIKVWNGIVEAWKDAGAWFNTNVVEPIANFFNGLWDGVKATFTLAWDFMTAAFKGYVNGWITIIEGFINFFIGAINLLIAGLNKISFDIPDWVPKIGGKSFGINISSVPPVKIPRLATGAVIPPNSEFLAVLGDQKHGRNIEAPEGLIKQIIEDALDRRGGQQSGNDKAVITLDGRVLGEFVIRYINDKTQLENMSPIMI